MTSQPTDAPPIDPRALDAALALFVRAFVVDAKRKQIHARLLTKERRRETLESLSRWLAGRCEELAGKDRSPAGLAARLGALTGIHLDERAARRTTITRALELGRAATTLFIGDNGRVALLTITDGAPLLLSA